MEQDARMQMGQDESGGQRSCEVSMPNCSKRVTSNVGRKASYRTYMKSFYDWCTNCKYICAYFESRLLH